MQLGDAFVGYQEDTPAAVVFQAFDHLKAAKQLKVDDTISKELENQVNVETRHLINVLEVLSVLPNTTQYSLIVTCKSFD